MAACDMGYTEDVESPDMTIEEMKRKAIHVDYDELRRHPEQYRGTVVEYTGKITQAVPGTEKAFRVYITKEYFWTDDIYLRVGYDISLITEDIIYFVGIARGNITYETVLGSERTIPLIDGYYVELSN